jgi:hypothetical protein
MIRGHRIAFGRSNDPIRPMGVRYHRGDSSTRPVPPQE